jgi:hypothetical protein
VEDGNITLDTLHKRIERIQTESGRHFKSSNVKPGTYLLHKINIKYGHKTEPLLLIMELHTGWLYAKLLPKIATRDIKTALYLMFEEMEAAYKIPLLLKEIIFLTHKHQSKAMLKKGEPPIEKATVIWRPVEKLIPELRNKLEDYHQARSIKTQCLPARPKDKIVLETGWKGRLLKKKIQEILEKYNHTKRTIFPRTKEKVAPRLRLRDSVLKSGRIPKAISNNPQKKRRPAKQTKPK